jgi:RNA polymerase sigma-70 factor (ECF subfamily)
VEAWAIRDKYEIFANSIQREMYCPPLHAVLYLIATHVVSKQTRGDAAVMKIQPMLSEEVLIASARTGSRNAFGELVRRHSRRVYGMSFKILKNREDAEDNLQNAFCKAYGKIGQFEGNSQFSTWLVRIAINEALMMLRKRQTVDVGESADGDRSTDNQWSQVDSRDLRADPERQYLTKELATKAFDILSPELRHTFILQKGEGWTSQEVAVALNIPADTVKSRIFRARVRLRRRLLALSKTASISVQA